MSTSIRNQKVWSIVGGAAIAILIVILGGVLLSAYFTNRVTLADPNVTEDVWREHYYTSVYATAGAVSLMTVIWLYLAHKGSGVGNMSGLWHVLWIMGVVAGAALLWWIPPRLQDGFELPLAWIAALCTIGYWLATLLMTPEHYRYTPWLAYQFFGRKSS